jgi:hypothetical protein
MEIRIFYSWQSDTDLSFNKYFIEKAIKKAVKNLKKDPDFAFNDLIFDRDTLGAAGTPHIPSTIDDKIKSCNIFIADLTIINSATGIQKLIQKIEKKLFKQKNVPLVQNPNVMKELGMASSVVDSTGIICIMNTFYGDPNNDASIIPFDIQQDRWPFQYNYSKKNKNNESEILNNLTSNFESAIKNSIRERILNPRFENYPFISWEMWKDLIAISNVKYYESKILNEIKNTIYSKGIIPQNSIRLYGFSGLGKTRLVFEAFNPKTDDLYKQTKKVLYYNFYSNQGDFRKIVDKLARSNVEKIIVIDNCDNKTHNQIQELIKIHNSKLSFISISPSPLKSELEIIQDGLNIEIEQDYFIEVIDNILKDFFPHDEKERDEIKKFSKGHTFIAVALAQERIKSKNENRPWRPIINKVELIDRILGEDAIGNSDQREIIRALSTFTKFGYLENLQSQTEIIAGNEHLISCTLNSAAKLILIRKICDRYLKSGVFETQGRYISVRIKPLALSLAVEWWGNATSEKVLKVFETLSNSELKINFCDQLRSLDFLDDAKEIVEKLCKGPFGKAEVINTGEGSRLFRSFVEVNPSATVQALETMFENWNIESLKQIDKGRRNLVWALEKLCFRSETFSKAVKILLSFAAAENETHISNNSTGQFLQLFQVHLAGTEVNLDARLQIIKYALNKSEKEYKTLGVLALSRGLLTDHFTRQSGAEEQGSGQPLHDYDPPFPEMIDYWKNIIEILYQLASSENEFKETAFKALVNSLRSLCSIGASSIILPKIEILIEDRKHNLIEIYDTLKFTYRFEKNRLHPELISKIKDLIDKLKPVDFESIYKTTVAVPNWEDYDEEGSYTEITIKKSEKLSEEFYNKLNELTNEFFFIFQGPQQNGFYFGRKLAELTNENIEKQSIFFNFSIRALLATEKEIRNVMVLAGFVAGIKDKETQRNYLLQIKNNVDLKYLSFMLTSSINIDFADLLNLFDLIDDKTFFISDFSVFKYGRALNNINSEDVLTFVKKVSDYGLDGKWTALSIIYMYCFSNNENWKHSKEFIKDLVLTNGILSFEKVNFRVDMYHWSDSVNKILKESSESLFAEEIIKEIIRFYDSTKHIYHTDPYITNVLIVLIENYFNDVWPHINKALLSMDEHYLLYHHFKHSIGSHLGGMGDKVGILFRGDHEKIFEWCKENTPIAPLRMVNIAPIFNDEELTQITWYTFTKRLIDEFGNIDGFLEELNANLGTWSWSGSLVPLLNNKRILLKELQHHHFSEVRTWVSNELIKLERRIKLESYEDQERYYN